MIRAMSEKLPHFIDPIYAAQHDKQFVGRVNFDHLKRLHTQVLRTEQDVEVKLLFFVDAELKLPAFTMKLDTTLSLECQRSLRPFALPVQTEIKGVFVESMALTEDIPPDWDVFELEETKLSLLELIEEELLLNIPMVPMDPTSVMDYQNDTSQPSLDESTAETETQNPFSALKGLKLNH